MYPLTQSIILARSKERQYRNEDISQISSYHDSADHREQNCIHQDDGSHCLNRKAKACISVSSLFVIQLIDQLLFLRYAITAAAPAAAIKAAIMPIVLAAAVFVESAVVLPAVSLTGSSASIAFWISVTAASTLS